MCAAGATLVLRERCVDSVHLLVMGGLQVNLLYCNTSETRAFAPLLSAQAMSPGEGRRRMKRFCEASPIWHAVTWIVIYVVVFNVGESISGVFGQPNSATAPLLLLLAIGLVLSLSTGDRLAHYGVRAPRRADLGADSSTRRSWLGAGSPGR